jgi:hypothetical protein
MFGLRPAQGIGVPRQIGAVGGKPLDDIRIEDQLRGEIGAEQIRNSGQSRDPGMIFAEPVNALVFIRLENLN